MSRVMAFLALLLIVALFLPWFSNPSGPGSISGYDIVYTLVMQTKDAMSSGASVGDMVTGDTWQAYILLLIPVFGLLTLLFGLAGAGIASATGFIAGLPAVVVTGKGLLDEGTDVLSSFDIGAWGTLVLSVLLVLLAFAPKRRG